MTDQPLVVVNDLVKHFPVMRGVVIRRQVGSVRAVDGISFFISRGETLGLVGESGCGKTTLIRCINGLIPRSYKGEINGRITVFGEETKDWSLARISQRIGTVLQDPERQILGSKVVNEVAFGLENLGLPRPEIRQRVDAALEQSGISHLKARETFSLSGGEKQRVLVARALAQQARVLLLDEPTSHMDIGHQVAVVRLLQRLADSGHAPYGDRSPRWIRAQKKSARNPQPVADHQVAVMPRLRNLSLR